MSPEPDSFLGRSRIDRLLSIASNWGVAELTDEELVHLYEDISAEINARVINADSGPMEAE